MREDAGRCRNQRDGSGIGIKHEQEHSCIISRPPGRTRSTEPTKAPLLVVCIIVHDPPTSSLTAFALRLCAFVVRLTNRLLMDI